MHYRAAPDVRGSGKERGHGAELKACPKCGEELKPGRHHVGCAAGKAKLHRRLVARSSRVSRVSGVAGKGRKVVSGGGGRGTRCA